MMYKGKNGQYVTAGVQAAPSMRMNVRSNVRLPDSEVGASWYEDGQKPFYAETVIQQKREPITVPLNGALVFLCLLFVVFGAMALSRVSHKAAIAKNINAMAQSISQIQRENDDLALQVMEARDTARISFDASHTLHMVSASEADTVTVYAPDTRPFENEQPIASVPGGMISGSR